MVGHVECTVISATLHSWCKLFFKHYIAAGEIYTCMLIWQCCLGFVYLQFQNAVKRFAIARSSALRLAQSQFQKESVVEGANVLVSYRPQQSYNIVSKWHFPCYTNTNIPTYIHTYMYRHIALNTVHQVFSAH